MEKETQDIIIDISKDLSEPKWLRVFREKKLKHADTLSSAITYGLGIAGSALAEDALFEDSPEYSVDASKGVEIYTWKEAVTQDEIVPYLERFMESDLYPNGETQGDARAAALFRSGIVVYAQPSMDDNGVLKEETCVLKTTLTSGVVSDVMIVIVKEGAKLFVHNIYEGRGGGTLARTFIILSENDAHSTVLQKSEGLKNGAIFLTNRAIIGQHSTVTWKELFIGRASVKSHTDSMLIGEGSCADMFQGLIPEADARQDISASTRHIASQTHSHIRAAGIGFDETKSVYRGLIDMKHGVGSVIGAQEGKFIVLSPSSEIDAIPSLDIASNDVACTHKLSVDYVHEGDIFYPKLRGFSDEESKMLFIEGHFAEVFAGKENEEIMENIRHTLSIRKSF